jgi:Lysyl oxidase/Secretion system C-terminal sorting domain
MKFTLLFFFSLFGFSASQAQCPIGEAELIYDFNCPSGDCYLSIYVYSSDFSELFGNEDFTFDNQYTGSICVPNDECLQVIVYNNQIPSVPDLQYTVSMNGEELLNITGIVYSNTNFANCVDGSMCEVPIILENDGVYTAESDDTWYLYTPETTGLYHVSTCETNTCDTKVWVYNTCPWSPDEGPPGTYAFNDDADCGQQAAMDLMLVAGDTYLIRIGDSYEDCLGSVNFSFNYVGPIIGCMDPEACNYNPLAQQSGDCIYYPNPDCALPDLQMNVETLLSSLWVMEVQSTNCDIEEGIVTGDGNRTVITFSVRIDNVGNADYYIGDPDNNPEMFEVVNCHGHVHYAGYGDYRLMDMQGNIIPAGHKNGFCVMDLCGFGQYNCGQMGISAGCYDQYGAGTSGQWFDITDVADGTYYGLVTVNPLLLPDALGRNESNYENNTYVFCFDLFTNEFGERDFTLLSECPSYYDCLGVENGTAQTDCNGICNGPSIWGDIVSDESLNNIDVFQYFSNLSLEEIDVTTCNDLSGNGAISIYDLALANVCVGESAQGGTSACDFPHDLMNVSGACGLAINNVNFDEGYIDVELKTPMHDIIAYQFSVDGIIISNVESLIDEADFNSSVGFNVFNNNVFALGNYLETIDNGSTAQPIIRIYYSQITSNTICISGITDIVTSTRSRAANYIYGDCVDATLFSIGVELSAGEISIMPNPVTTQVTISFDRFVSSPKQLFIRDQVGRIVKTVAVDNGNHTMNVDLSSLSSGIYTITTEGNHNLEVAVRFVKL